MAAFNYARTAASTLRLLAKFGGDVRIEGPPERVVKGVRVKTVVHEILGSTDKTGVQVGDIQYIVAATAVTSTGESVDTEPAINERIATPDQNLVIVAVDPIRPAELTLAWYVYGRIG